jgi:hypothetical protein
LHGEHILVLYGLTQSGNLDLQTSCLISIIGVFAIPEFFADLPIELVFIDLVYPRPHRCQALLKRGKIRLALIV